LDHNPGKNNKKRKKKKVKELWWEKESTNSEGQRDRTRGTGGEERARRVSVLPASGNR
jgi:hypothetical protein